MGDERDGADWFSIVMHHQGDSTRLLITCCQGGQSWAQGRLLMWNDLQPGGMDGQTPSLWLRGVTQVLLARREVLREDSFGKKLLGFLVR